MSKEIAGTGSPPKRLSVQQSSSSTETDQDLGTTGGSASSAQTYKAESASQQDSGLSIEFDLGTSRYESFSIDAMRSHSALDLSTLAIRTRLQAEHELRDEEFRRRVEAEKEWIKKMQSPRLAEIRKRDAAREFTNQQAFHAQIMSVAA